MTNFFKSMFLSKNHEKNDHVSSFHDQPEEKEDVQLIDHGVKTIALEKIIGSVGKYYDLTLNFILKSMFQEKDIQI